MNSGRGTWGQWEGHMKRQTYLPLTLVMVPVVLRSLSREGEAWSPPSPGDWGLHSLALMRSRLPKTSTTTNTIAMTTTTPTTDPTMASTLVEPGEGVGDVKASTAI